MSKKHPGINEWRQHLQPGRRKPGKAATPDEPVVDARKPPGWQGRAAKAKAKNDRSGSAAKPARSVPSSTGAKPPSAVKTPPAAPVPTITAPKRGLERPVDGEGRPYITLVQFLKTIDVVGTGGAGKHAIRAGGFLVNGSEELRPGRKLHAGDVVTVSGVEHPVTL